MRGRIVIVPLQKCLSILSCKEYIIFRIDYAEIKNSMIQTFITPTESNYNIVLELSEDYLGQELEVIVLKKKRV